MDKYVCSFYVQITRAGEARLAFFLSLNFHADTRATILNKATEISKPFNRRYVINGSNKP